MGTISIIFVARCRAQQGPSDRNAALPGLGQGLFGFVRTFPDKPDGLSQDLPGLSQDKLLSGLSHDELLPGLRGDLTGTREELPGSGDRVLPGHREVGRNCVTRCLEEADCDTKQCRKTCRDSCFPMNDVKNSVKNHRRGEDKENRRKEKKAGRKEKKEEKKNSRKRAKKEKKGKRKE